MIKSAAKKYIDRRHFVAIFITAGFAVIAVFRFPYAFTRLWESVRDFGLSVAFYFDEIFGEGAGGIIPTVNELSSVSLPSMLGITESFDEFKLKWGEYWAKFIETETITGYFQYKTQRLSDLSKVLVVTLPLFILSVLLIKQYFVSHNNRYDVDSKAVRALRRIEKSVYNPVKGYIMKFITFLNAHKIYFILWFLIWGYSFNIIQICLEAFAYYFYFAASFDILHIYLQAYKLTVDLSALFGFMPPIGWMIIAYAIICRMRKNVALRRLNHYERRNRGFINERPIVFMVCGTMGTKKTTTITDMALSQEIMLRDKAFEKILENDIKFPYFPWINLENEVKRAMKYHEIFNLATCKRFAAKKKARWEKSGRTEKIFSYDYSKYGTTYDDQLRITDIWEVIENYVQLYFIYVIQSSLIISNYAVRTDNSLSDKGNFPMWDTNLFLRDSRLIEAYSRHSHILDFDSLRLGRKLVEDNKYADTFEFGVIVLTEIGKERGNNLELIEKKKKDDSTNQKNDLFNYWLKMVRHSATVDNFPFVKVITDEQRPASWGADARDLCDIVTIVENSEQKLAMPFFFVSELLYAFLFGKFEELYYTYRYNRSDNTLPMYLFKAFCAKFFKFYHGKYNLYGYSLSKVRVEAGTQDGKKKVKRYYLANKKIYSKRFSTDCFSDFFTQKSLRSKFGIADLPEYETEKATLEELSSQNSYFIRDLYDGLFKRSKVNED